MGTLHINLLGASFSIQSTESSDYLQELLLRYKNSVASIEQSVDLKDNIKIAILAGLSLCDELKKSEQNLSVHTGVQKQNDSELFEAERITLKLIDHIDKALK